jgi:hypothetical protein
VKPDDFWKINDNELSEQQTKRIEDQWIRVANE